MTEEIPDILIPPHVKEAVIDHKFWEGFTKAFGVDDQEESETELNPYNDGRDVDADKFLEAAASPDRYLTGQTWGPAVAHSFHAAANLARCKNALDEHDWDGAHAAVCAAMRNHSNTHAAICAAAPAED